jgi:hypothetical protein
MARKKKDGHDDRIMAICAIIVAIIELARFIFDYLVK